MRRLALFCVLCATLLASPAAAQISLLGLQNSLVQFALEQISVPGSFEITAGGVEEPEDGVTELVDLRIADAEGVWFEADGAALAWRPSRILLGELAITRLRARGVRVLRAPVQPPPPAEAVEEQVEEDPPFEWPRAPVAVVVDSVTLVDVAIAPGVIAERGIGFDAAGSARDEGDVQALTLSLTRDDAVAGGIEFDYARDFEANTLRLTLSADEGPGGLAAALAGLPAESATRLTLGADGPLDDWVAQFRAEIEDVATARGVADLSLAAPLSVFAEIEATPGPALDPAVAAALAPRATLRLRAAEGADGVVEIAEGALVSEALSLGLDGTYARETGAFDAEIALEARSGLSALAPGLDVETVGFDGAARGTLEAFEAGGALTVAGLRTAPADVAKARFDAEIGRDGGATRFALTGEAEGLRLDRLGPELLGAAALDLAGALEGETLRLDRLRLAGPLLEAEASGALGEAGAAVSYGVAAPELAPVAAAYGLDAAGALAMEGRVEGALDAPRLIGTVALDDLSYQGESWGAVRAEHDVTLGEAVEGAASVAAEGSPYGAASVSTGFALADRTLALSGFDAEAVGLALSGDVDYALEEGLADGAVAFRLVEPDALAARSGLALTGEAEGRLALSRAGDRQDVAVEAEGRDVAGFGARLASFEINAEIRDALGAPTGEGLVAATGLVSDIAAIEALRFEGAAGLDGEALDAQGTLDAEGIEAAGARIDAVSALIDGADVLGEGALQASLTAAGVSGFGAQATTIGFDGAATDLAGALAAEGVLTVEEAAYPEADLRARRIVLDAAGRDLLGALDAEGELLVERLSLPGGGAERLTADFAGEALLDAPEATLAARLEGLSTEAARAEWVALEAEIAQEAEGARAAAALSSAPIALEGGRIDAVSARAEATDPFGPDLVLDAEAEIGPARFGDARLSRAALTARGPREAIEATATARGGLGEEAPFSLDLAARVDAGTPGTVSAEIARLAARYDEADLLRLRRPLRIVSAEGTTRLERLDAALPGGGATGAATLHPDGAELDISLRIGDLAPLAALADAPVESGALDLTARLDSRAESAGGRLDLEARRVLVEGLPDYLGAPTFDLSADGRWNGARATVDATLSGPMDRPLTAALSTALIPSDGPAPTVPQGAALDGRVRWDGRIGDLWALVPARDHILDGDASIDLRLGGRADAPRISGDVAIRDGQYQNLMLGTILTELTVSSRIAPDGGLLLGVEAQDGAGAPVRAEADISGTRLAAEIRAENAVLVRRDDAVAAISLAIDAEGDLAETLAVTGEVMVERAEIRLVNATPPSVASLGDVRFKGEEAEEEDASAGGDVTLDLRIAAPDEVFVRGRGLDSEWTIALDVGGTAAEPLVEGAIERRRGALDLVGVRFDLERGEIRFLGEPDIDPRLDIAVTRENDGVAGGIYVEGFASDPQISFRSRPALDESEVLPRVLFGKSSQGLSSGEAIQLAVGLSTLLDGTGGGALGAVRSAVGVDVLRLDTEGEAAAVEVGANVIDNVYVGAKQPVDGGSTQVQVEVEIFDNFTVDSEVGGDSGASFGLNWKRDF